ncbi:MAG TPA: hypothetical protein VII69_08450 [Candidatus Eremiobacteraceae bacterium]
MRNAGRIVAVLLAAYALCITLPDLTRAIGHPVYLFGYSLDSTGAVSEVNAGSSAAAAGVRPGDHLDLSGIQRDLRAIALVGGSATPHARATISFTRNGLRRVVVVSAESPEPPYRGPLVLARELAGIVYVIVGVALVLIRPSAMTWGFFLFCCAFNPAPFAVFVARTPFVVLSVAFVINAALAAAGVVGVAVFALRFPSGVTLGWRTVAERICVALFVPLAAMDVYGAMEKLFFGAFTFADTVALGLTSALALLAVVALVTTYRVASGAERSRIQWVIFGSGASLLAFGADALLLVPLAPYWVHAVLLATTVCMPLAVAYAVIKHRVIDVRFVISRTLVYAVLTTILVGVFTLIDWFIGKVLDQTGLALTAELVAALALGFWMNGLHHRVDQFIDSVLFWQRYLAARRLMRAAAGLPHAANAAAVDEMLVGEPVDALKLASAALFRTRDGVGFARAAALNWPDGGAETLDASEQIVLQLKGERAPLLLDDVRWPRHDLPLGDRAPALAVPVFVRDRMFAIALYGSHSNGEALDTDEISSLDRLAAGAAAAYDHIEAEALRAEIELLRAQISTTRG